MKIAGVEVKGPNTEILVLPRPDGPIVIKAQAVCDMSDFDTICPLPKAPTKLTKDGPVQILKDPTYLSNLQAFGDRKMAYMVLKSLEPSQIEWETVDMGNPKTWPNWEKELRKAGFSDFEISRITMCAMQANSLDETKLREAREVFLRGQEEADKKSSGPQTELENMPSGQPAKDSE